MNSIDPAVLRQAAVQGREDRRRRAKAQQEREAQVAASHPFLVRRADRPTLSLLALAALNAKRMLGHHFPDIEFQVRRKEQRGWSRLTVSWVRWPEQEQRVRSSDVRRVLQPFVTLVMPDNPYEDGMTRDTDPANEAFRSVFGETAHLNDRGRDPEPEEVFQRAKEAAERKRDSLDAALPVVSAGNRRTPRSRL